MSKQIEIGQTVSFADFDGQLVTGPVIAVFPHRIATIATVHDIATDSDILLNVDEWDFAVIPA